MLATETIDAIYRSYALRSATAADIAFWQTRPSGDDGIADVRHAILNDPTLGALALDQIRDLYGDYAGRAIAALLTVTVSVVRALPCGTWPWHVLARGG